MQNLVGIIFTSKGGLKERGSVPSSDAAIAHLNVIILQYNVLQVEFLTYGYFEDYDYRI